MATAAIAGIRKRITHMADSARKQRKADYEEAYATVVRIRGSNDVPAFDLCVKAEMRAIRERRRAKGGGVMAARESFSF